MKSFDIFVLARTLHVISVLFWIGGVAFVTTVLIPALRKPADPDRRFELFEKRDLFGYRGTLRQL